MHILSWYLSYGCGIQSHIDWIQFSLTHWGRDKMAPNFSDNIFKCIFFNENAWVSIKISLKFVPRGPINNIPAWVQIMAWRRPGDKPLSESVMVRLPTHICLTRHQWVHHCIRLFQIIDDVEQKFRFIMVTSMECDHTVAWKMSMPL